MRLARLTALALLAAPLAAETQVSGRVPRVGFLGHIRSPATVAFEQALKDLGWEDGRNIALEWRWAQGDPAPRPLASRSRRRCSRGRMKSFSDEQARFGA